MAKIQYIKDKENVTVYPVTHERAVRDSNNVTLETKLGQKQEALVSGTNIKTINNESILGSGNLSVVVDVSGKQDTLVSGTNIKTVNGESLLGSGDITAGDPDAVKYTIQSLTSEQKEQARTNINAQESLVSGTNIKTVNNQSILGTGNITAGIDNVTSPQDGTILITLSNGDVVTVDLNHDHPAYPKYILLSNEAAYTALATKESDTLYLIPE